MKALSLYSGGCDGMSLAGSWVGIETVAFCENDPACRAVLSDRHPERPIFHNDEEVTADAIRAAGIDPAGIDIVMGGPPCQCASIAGKRLGDGDPRNRWPQFLRIVREIRPRWVVAENSPELCTVNAGRLFGNILRELAEAWYDAVWQCWGAADVGAPHKRERLFIVGYAQRGGCGRESWRRSGEEPPDGHMGNEELANTKGERCGEAREYSGRSEEWVTDGGLLADATSEGLPRSNQIRDAACRAEGNARVVDGFERRGSMEYADSQRFEKCDSTAIDEQSRFPDGRSLTHGCYGPTQSGLGRMPAGVLTRLDEVAAFLEGWPWPAGKGQEQFEWEPPRVAAGVPDRVARLRMIGNACPPQQYLPALWAVVETERMMDVE